MDIYKGLRASDFGLVLVPEVKMQRLERLEKDVAAPQTRLLTHLLRVAAVVLLFSGGVVAALMVLPYWGGQNSRTTLGYEDALQLLAHPGTPSSKRTSAMGRAFITLKEGLILFRQCEAAPGLLGANARLATDKLRKVLSQ